MGIMGIGAAAGGGLDALQNIMEQRLRQAQLLQSVKAQQDQLAEMTRAHYADEANRQQAIQDAAENRRQALADQAEYRRQQLEDRDYAQRQKELDITPGGTFLTQEQAAPYQPKGGQNIRLEPVPGTQPLQPGDQGPTMPGGFRVRPSLGEEKLRSAEDIAAERSRSSAEVAAANRAAQDARAEAARAVSWAGLGLARERFQQQVNPADDPRLPNAVKKYLAEIHNRNPTEAKGQEELGNALQDDSEGSLTQSHPGLDADKAVGALKRMYARPAGSSVMADLFNQIEQGQAVPSHEVKGIKPATQAAAPAAPTVVAGVTSVRDQARQALVNARQAAHDNRPVTDADVDTILARRSGRP